MLPIVVEPDSLEGQFDEHVVEHHLFHLIESGDFEGRNLSPSELHALFSLIGGFLEGHKSAAFLFVSIGKLDEKTMEVCHFNLAGRVRVIDGPDALEFLKGPLLDRQFIQVSLAEECIDDDGNEQVEEDLGHDHLEEQVEANCNAVASAATGVEWILWISPISNHSFVGLVLNALVHDGVGLGAVKHD